MHQNTIRIIEEKKSIEQMTNRLKPEDEEGEGPGGKVGAQDGTRLASSAAPTAPVELHNPNPWQPFSPSSSCSSSSSSASFDLKPRRLHRPLLFFSLPFRRPAL